MMINDCNQDVNRQIKTPQYEENCLFYADSAAVGRNERGAGAAAGGGHDNRCGADVYVLYLRLVAVR